MESSFLTSRFFYLVCKLCKGLFQSLCQSVNSMSWVFESWNIPRRCHVINLYLRPCGIAIYGKFYSYCLYHRRHFCSVNCENLLCKLYITFGSVKIHTHCLYWSAFSTDLNGKIIFNCLLLFKPFLLVSKLCESSQQIPQFYSDMLRNWGKVYIRGSSVFSFMESSIPTFQQFL